MPSVPYDVEAQTRQQPKVVREAKHRAEPISGGDCNPSTVKLGCCGVFCLGMVIGLIVLLTSIHTLGPEEQVVIESGDGKYVRNGPKRVILSPSRKKTFRKATRLGPLEYAIVKNTKSGKIRHEEGPQLLWLEAWDNIEATPSKIVLQLHEYARLVDSMTGAERVIVGPAILVPKPLEKAPNGTQSAKLVTEHKSVLTMNKTTGKYHLVTKTGVFTPAAYELIIEERQAHVLTERLYALVKDKLTGVYKHVEGPKLLKIGAYEQLLKLDNKTVLQRDQFMVLKDNKTGVQRVVKGPQTFVPHPSEASLLGIQQAPFIDTDTAVLVLNRTSGQQRLVQKRGVFFPEAEERILEKRELIRVLPHEAIAVRNSKGKVTVYNGMEGVAAFFLPPYTKTVQMEWSDFSEIPTGGKQARGKVKVDKIDLRTRKIFFSYEVPTSDNVKLQLDGTIFWKVVSVSKMLNGTSDPEGDVWHHSRSALIQAVSKVSLQDFMQHFSHVSDEALKVQAKDGFYEQRGVALESMELTSFECVEESTAKILQQIIQETTNRINRLQVQESQNEVRAASMQAEIELEKKRTALITAKAENARLEAEMAGDADGMQLMRAAASFIGGLNESVPDIEQRVGLYEMHERLKSKNKDTQNLAAGKAKMFLTPEDVNLKSL